MEAVQTIQGFEVPAHIPPELVHYIGLTEGEDFLAAPHKFMAALHDRLPRIFYSPSVHNPGAWYAIRHEDAFFVLRHPELFSSADSTPFPRDPNKYFKMIPLEIEPPEHRKYRAVLDPMFSPAAVARMEADIRKFANELIDQFVDKGEVEFTTAFGRPLPVGVFLRIMGLPMNMLDTFVGWAMDLLHSQSREAAGKAMKEVCAYLEDVIQEKLKTPDDGAVSVVAHSKPGGEPMSERDTFGFVFFLFIAGLDTVFAALNNIFVWLAENPDRRREIIETPENIGGVVEELLRVFAVTFSGRTLTQDYEMHGVRLRKGEKITSILPAANYDPTVFENPTKVDFNRPRKPHLAFAGGVHSCMGAHLARLEVKICIQEFLRRIPEFSLKPGTKIEYYPGGVIGPKKVPLVW